MKLEFGSISMQFINIAIFMRATRKRTMFFFFRQTQWASRYKSIQLFAPVYFACSERDYLGFFFSFYFILIFLFPFSYGIRLFFPRFYFTLFLFIFLFIYINIDIYIYIFFTFVWLYEYVEKYRKVRGRFVGKILFRESFIFLFFFFFYINISDIY